MVAHIRVTRVSASYALLESRQAEDSKLFRDSSVDVRSRQTISFSTVSGGEIPAGHLMCY